MRYLLVILTFLAIPLGTVSAEEPEIVIELTGDSDKKQNDGINIWDKDAKALTRLLKNKTREEALALITSVSTKDANVRATDGTKYRFVQYGREGGYRKFLFRAKEPQTFVAVATSPQESLSLFAQYKVNIGISETEFLALHPEGVTPVPLPTPNGQTLYKLQQAETSQFFLFKNNQLTRLMTPQEADQLQQNQQKSLATAQSNKAPQNTQTKKFKALVSGGTLTDQMYLPRVINPPHEPTAIPPVPSKLPPGTPLWPQTVNP